MLKQNFIGKKFSRLLVLEEKERKIYYYENKPRTIVRRFLCICDCGKKVEVNLGSLKNGNTKSCGCLNLELITALGRKHGFTSTESTILEKDTYSIWAGIKQRCYNPNCLKYKYYGGKGIKMCDRWRNSFENFVSDMGIKPSDGLSIDRINPRGDYEINNCRWVNFEVQSSNRTDSIRIEYKGKKYSLKELSHLYNIKPRTIRARVFEYGWNLDLALNSPVDKRIKNRNRMS